MTGKKSQFLKRIKPKQKQEMRQVNQKTMNYLFLGGFLAIIALAGLSILSSLAHSNEPKTIIQKTETKPSSVDYQLQYYLNDYIQAYFNLSDDNTKQNEEIDKLNNFYDVVPETKNQGQIRTTTELLNAKVLLIEDNIATYQVTYTTGKDNDKKEITTGFAIPYGEKGGKYYISGLPWYVSLPRKQATHLSSTKALSLTDDTNTSTKTKKKLDSFLNLFFTNYTTNQDNLDLLANGLTALKNTEYQSLDYSYYQQKGKNTIAYVQVTFEVAGNTHSENFTLTLTPKNKSYFVQSLKHTIATNYYK